MKKLVILFAGICISNSAPAQSSSSTQAKITQYLFPDFVKGSVRLKSGLSHQTELNYNMLTLEMVFLHNGEPLAIAEPQNIDTVFIQHRKFIADDKGFVELATNTPISLLIRHSCKIIPPGQPAGYGTTSETSHINSVNKLVGVMTYGLDLPKDYKVNATKEFFLKKGIEVLKISNSKQVLKFFPGKTTAIETFIKSNNIDFKKPEDVVKLIEFCNSAL